MKTKHDWSRLDAMTAEQRHAAALADPDAQPLSDADMDRMKPTPRLKIIPAAAPIAYDALPAPHAVFIGGGISEPGTFEGAWERLRPGGRMVANVVTLEGEMHLYDLQEKHGGELVRIDISTLTRVGTLRAMRPRMAVTQWRVTKP